MKRQFDAVYDDVDGSGNADSTYYDELRKEVDLQVEIQGLFFFLTKVGLLNSISSMYGFETDNFLLDLNQSLVILKNNVLISSHYRQFSPNHKMKNHKINASFVILFLFYYPGKDVYNAKRWITFKVALNVGLPNSVINVKKHVNG